MNTTLIQKVYDDIALNVFQSYKIVRDGELFDLAEIEIYLINPYKGIDDTYIHAHKEQNKYRHIYFHYSGIDICFGDNKEVYCGVLVRGILNDINHIYGPGRVAYKHPKIRRDIKLINVPSDTQLIFSEQVKDNINLKNVIFKLPRVNLSAERMYNSIQTNIDKASLFLNLKARYLRIKDEKFYTPKSNAPDEHKEIFNKYIEYLIQRKSAI